MPEDNSFDVCTLAASFSTHFNSGCEGELSLQHGQEFLIRVCVIRDKDGTILSHMVTVSLLSGVVTCGPKTKRQKGKSVQRTVEKKVVSRLPCLYLLLVFIVSGCWRAFFLNMDPLSWPLPLPGSTNTSMKSEGNKANPEVCTCRHLSFDKFKEKRKFLERKKRQTEMAFLGCVCSTYPGSSLRQLNAPCAHRTERELIPNEGRKTACRPPHNKYTAYCLTTHTPPA